jgi:phosphoglycerate dehydrogenase-like enzyme
MKLTLLGAYCKTADALLRSNLTTKWDIRCWEPADSDDDLTQTIDGAEAVVVGADALLSGRIFAAMKTPSLRLFQIPFSGHEWLQKGMIPDDCAACNIYTHGSTIAEYVMAAMLHFEVKLATISADFKTGSWRYGGSVGIGERHGELAGKTLGLVGYGDIGQGIAKRAHGFDMDVIATVSTHRKAPAPLSWLGSADDLNELLTRSDYVVLACPANAHTVGLINKTNLVKMKPGAVLINVARGQVCVEADLFAALKDRVIGGAVLDTWYQYPTPTNPNPKPANLPFETLDNVVMTPHCSAWSEAHHQRRWVKVAENLDRLAKGQKLENVIF